MDRELAKKYFSSANQERCLVQDLHCKAAETIFEITNHRNIMWKIDFHGLHGKEAIHFLHNHFKYNRSKSTNNAKTFGGHNTLYRFEVKF